MLQSVSLDSQQFIPNVSNLLHASIHHPLLREWSACEKKLQRSALMLPIFVTFEDAPTNVEGPARLSSLPGQYKFTPTQLIEYLNPLVEAGLRSVLLFSSLPPTVQKDNHGSLADDATNPVMQVIPMLRNIFPSLLVATDVCLCAYTDHGHCGILDKNGHLDNTASVNRLAQVALSYATAGAQLIAPSDMMDGRIAAIKHNLHLSGLSDRVAVMSYSAKFASCLYGPFRSVSQSAPQKGDRSGYQLPVASSVLSRRALQRDAAEGADILLIKPCGFYLDVVQQASQWDRPVAVYQVSGEYAMIRAAAESGVVSLKEMVMESLQCAARAGASIFITYYAPELLLEWL